jgi:hypothetical protein
VKWVVDPGLDGDVYADQPYLYGPALSSVNTLHVGASGASSKSSDTEDEQDGAGEGEVGEAGMVFEEGGHEEGLEVRREKGVPDTEAARKKYFLNEENRKAWTWEEGRTYGCDFFNPYLDFNGEFGTFSWISHWMLREMKKRNENTVRRDTEVDANTKPLDFALRLPGFTLPIMKYWDGQGLRCVSLPSPLFVTLPSNSNASFPPSNPF